MYWDKLLSDEQVPVNKLSPSEYVDILTFADILSLSSDAQHKNFALKIISCLKCFYSKKYKRQLFVVYDLGVVRDELEFIRDIENAKDDIKVIIVKQ